MHYLPNCIPAVTKTTGFDLNSFNIGAGNPTASSTQSFASKDKDKAEQEEIARCKR